MVGGRDRWESCEMCAARLLTRGPTATCVAVGGRPPPPNSAGHVAAPRQRPPCRPRGRGGCERVGARARHPHIGRPLARHARGLDAPAAGALMVAAGARQAGGRRRAGGRAWAARCWRAAPRPVRAAAALTAGLLELNASVKDATQGQPNSSRPDPEPDPNPDPDPDPNPDPDPDPDPNPTAAPTLTPALTPTLALTLERGCVSHHASRCGRADGSRCRPRERKEKCLVRSEPQPTNFFCHTRRSRPTPSTHARPRRRPPSPSSVHQGVVVIVLGVQNCDWLAPFRRPVLGAMRDDGNKPKPLWSSARFRGGPVNSDGLPQHARQDEQLELAAPKAGVLTGEEDVWSAGQRVSGQGTGRRVWTAGQRADPPHPHMLALSPCLSPSTAHSTSQAPLPRA